MSKLGCRCGHVIGDQTDDLPYKARILSDLNDEGFFGWVAAKTASYVEAVRERRTNEWFLEQGYGQEYIDLKLDHKGVLHDLIHARFLVLQRGMYECQACGRIHIETREDNHFVSHTPDSGKVNAVLATADGVKSEGR